MQCWFCPFKLNRRHFSCPFCRHRKWMMGEVPKNKFTKARLQLLIKRDPNGNMLIPSENAWFYIMAVDGNQKHSRIKGFFLKKILSFCESILAN